MTNSNPQLLDRLTPAFLGAIVIGSGELTTELAGFSELNYLFDGLLSQAIHFFASEEKKSPLSFITLNFGQKFFLHYLNEFESFPMGLINIQNESRNKVLIINTNPHTTLSVLDFEKHFSGLNLEVISLF